MALQSTARILVSLQQAMGAEKVPSNNPVFVKSISTNATVAGLVRKVEGLLDVASITVEMGRDYIGRFQNTDKIKSVIRAEEEEKILEALYDKLGQIAKRTQTKFNEVLAGQINSAIDQKQTTESGITKQQLEKISGEVGPVITAANNTIEKSIGVLAQVRDDFSLPPLTLEQPTKPKQIPGQAPVLRK